MPYRRAVEADEARQRFLASPVARLATVRPDGAPHLVPVVFAAEDDVVYTVVDTKPKRTTRLQRLANLRSQPRCALLVDHYDADWSRLWWVRVDGEARVVNEPPSSHRGLDLLAARYPVYADARPSGPLVVVNVNRWSGWSAAS
ncbi:MAG: TIGR03668 family PPOX class F420-dependent oxidoreductase [Euzebyales bacterium]|nr:TIGR03668 family PPOX class F420-dependent oxidoreductase [Euzebyales bacterium]